MDTREYIQSGIIESYVLGLADAQEAAELERLRTLHPEIEAAIQTFEKELEAAAFANAVPVDSHVKADLFKELELAPQEQPSIPTTLRPESKTNKTSFLKYLAAAAVLLFVVSAAMNVYIYSRYKTVQRENVQLALQRDQLFADNSKTQTKFNELDERLRLIAGPDIIKIPLAGVPGKENSQAIVFWNKSNKDVYLLASSLPKAPKGKQYQLWALMDGQPIDAGVLQDCTTVCKLKNIANAQAFAITLENEGGSPTPNLEQLFVMGKI
ncbi:anti-sigma factor [Niabella insulamsoli]|uniref:anti-sigma factor n=1 Tax=Niabella insulamsoli TaxID=3144874 RepID=UPI0031FC126B